MNKGAFHRYFIWLLTSFLIAAGSGLAAGNGTEDLKSLLARVIENQKKNRRLQTTYLYEMNLNIIKLDKGGQEAPFRNRTFEIVPLEGEDYRKLIRKNGKPLPAEELEQEQRKLEKEFRKQSFMSASQKAKREAQKRDRLEKEERAWDEVLNAFALTLVGKEQCLGRPALLITFDPRSSFRTQDNDLRFLKQIRGRVWIDETELQILRVKAEITDDLKFGGGFLAKIQKGGTFHYDQQKINQEVWFPARSEALLSGRVLLLKGFNFKIINEFSNFRKYETSVHIMPAQIISPSHDEKEEPLLN